ncbi:MAG: ABC transporter ATP-binding protein, partial [Brachybacterium sp.]
ELIALWEQERKTVLMVTHDIDEAIILSDRVIVMSGRPGTLREDITVPFDRPRSFDIERSPEFSELRSRIWNLLREDARTAEETA